MAETLVSEAFATGEEIAPIVERIEIALGDVPRTHALIALTSIILLLQHPDLTQEQMYNGVKDVSQFVCMWLAGTESPGDSVEPAKMN